MNASAQKSSKSKIRLLDVTSSPISSGTEPAFVAWYASGSFAAGAEHLGPYEDILRLQVASFSSTYTVLQIDSSGRKRSSRRDDAFHKQLDQVRRGFDLKYGLDGNSKALTWGLVKGDNRFAACITLHPTDTIEYVTPALEHTRVIFGPALNNNKAPFPLHTRSPEDTTAAEVHLRILSKIFDLAEACPVLTLLDRTIVGVAAVHAYMNFTDTALIEMRKAAISKLQQSPQNIHSQVGDPTASVDRTPVQSSLMALENPQTSVAQSSDAETQYEICDICESRIDFEDAQWAFCGRGHQYSESAKSVFFVL